MGNSATKLDQAPQDLPRSLTDGFEDVTWYSLDEGNDKGNVYLCVDDLGRLWRWRRNGGGHYCLSTLTSEEEVEYRTILGRQNALLVRCKPGKHIFEVQPGTRPAEQANAYMMSGGEGLPVVESCPLCAGEALDALWDQSQREEAEILELMGANEAYVNVGRGGRKLGQRVITFY